MILKVREDSRAEVRGVRLAFLRLAQMERHNLVKQLTSCLNDAWVVFSVDHALPQEPNGG